MPHPTSLRAFAGGLALAAGLATVAACGDVDGTPAPSTVATTPTRPVPTTSPSPTTPTLGQGLPDGFPTDAVPLLDETVVGGSKGSPGGAFAWSVVMSGSRSIDVLSAEVTKEFADAGYRTDRSTEMGDVSIHDFSNATYRVGVTIARTGDGITVTYLVKDRG